MKKGTQPYYSAWHHDLLAQHAADQFVEIDRLREENESLKQELATEIANNNKGKEQ